MALRTLEISLCLALLFSQTSSCRHSKTTSNSPNTTNKAQSTPTTKTQSNITGLWGGQGISFEAGDEGVKIEFDCAHGTIAEKIVTDSKAMFLVQGSYVRERPGPTHQDGNAEAEAAEYSGSIQGKTMNLTVTLSKTKESLGTFKLTQGKTGRLRKCG